MMMMMRETKKEVKSNLETVLTLIKRKIDAYTIIIIIVCFDQKSIFFPQEIESMMQITIKNCIHISFFHLQNSKKNEFQFFFRDFFFETEYGNTRKTKQNRKMFHL